MIKFIHLWNLPGAAQVDRAVMAGESIRGEWRYSGTSGRGSRSRPGRIGGGKECPARSSGSEYYPCDLIEEWLPSAGQLEPWEEAVHGERETGRQVKWQ